MHEETASAAKAPRTTASWRLDMMERALAMALDAAAKPGAVYDGLLEAAGALRDFRVKTELMQEVQREAFADGRASVLAEQAAGRHAARPALRALGLSG